MSLWNKLKYLNPNIFRTRCCKPLIFQTQIIWFNRIHSLKYLRYATLGSKDIVIWKQNLWQRLNSLFPLLIYSGVMLPYTLTSEISTIKLRGGSLLKTVNIHTELRLQTLTEKSMNLQIFFWFKTFQLLGWTNILINLSFRKINKILKTNKLKLLLKDWKKRIKWIFNVRRTNKVKIDERVNFYLYRELFILWFFSSRKFKQSLPKLWKPGKIFFILILLYLYIILFFSTFAQGWLKMGGRRLATFFKDILIWSFFILQTSNIM